MIFDGTFLCPIASDDGIQLPSDWLPEDGIFCAYVPPKAMPPCLAVYPLNMADQLIANLPVANQITGLAMEIMYLDVVAEKIVIPAGVKSMLGLLAEVTFVGKGAYFQIVNRSAYPNVSFLAANVRKT